MPISQVTLGIKNKRTALEKDLYVIIMKSREGLSYQGADKSVKHKHAGTIHGVFSSSRLSGEILMLPSRSTVGLNRVDKGGRRAHRGNACF